MFTYQLAILIISILAIAFITKRFHNDALSVGTYLGWFCIWILVILAGLFPGISVHLARITGLGRGLDALYIIAIIIVFYVLFKLYNKIEDQKRRINDLVSELALQEEDDLEHEKL